MVRSPGHSDLRLSADQARLNFDSNMLVLEEGARITPPTGKSLGAPVAVIAQGHDGLYLPSGYWQDTPRAPDCRIAVVISPRLGTVQDMGRVCDHPPLHATAFLALTSEGALVPAATVPAIDYADPVDRREQIVLSQFLDRVPDDLRPLLFLLSSRDVPIRLQGVDPGSPKRPAPR